MHIAMVPKAILPETLAIIPRHQAIILDHMEAMKHGMATKAGTIIQLTEDITLILALLITVTIMVTQTTILIIQAIILITLITIITQATITTLRQYTITSPITTTIITECNTTSQGLA